MGNIRYLDELGYDGLIAPEVQSEDPINISVESIIDKYNFNNQLKNELLNELNAYVEKEVKTSTLEFVNRFMERLGKGSKLGFATARALGFHVYLKDKQGNEIHTLKEIADYWNVCPQLVDQLSKQIQKDLQLDPITNLSIHKKNYSYKVKSPKGYMTTGEVLSFLNISNKKLNSIIKTLGIRKKDYLRGSKLVAEEDINSVELYLMEGK